MRRRHLDAMRPLAAALALGLALSAAAQAAPAPAAAVPVEGSVVSLVPPAGFVPAKDYPGFQGRQASIRVADMDGTFDEIAQAMTPANAAAQGFRIVRREDLKGLPFKAVLFTAAAAVSGKAADKWLLIAERPGGVSLINAVAVHEAGALTDDQAHTLMRSVRLAAQPHADLFTGLGYSLNPPSALSHRQAVPGVGVAMTAEPPGEDNAGQPSLIVGAVFQQPVAPKDRVAAFAYALEHMEGMTLTPGGAPAPVKVGGLDALQAALTGKDAAGRPIEAAATLVFGPAKAYLILGVAAPAAFPAMEPGFKAATTSFRVRPAP